jgi:hypothetical protein
MEDARNSIRCKGKASADIITMETLARQVDDLGVHFHEDELANDRSLRDAFKKSRIEGMRYRKSSVLLFRIQFRSLHLQIRF